MAASDIDDSFVAQFEDEVHLAYQRMGSKFMNTIRRKTNVVGSSTTFQKIGTVEMGTKSRNGQVPISNQSHDPVQVNLTDYYSGQFIDSLDELKIEHDERSVTTTNQAASAGRKSDENIIAAFEAAAVAGNTSAASTGALNKAKFDEAYKYMGENDVPMDDGQCFAAVSPAGWLDLMDLDTFASADYVGVNDLVYSGVLAKSWMGYQIYQHSGLTNPSGTVRNCLAYHRTSAGHASGTEVKIDLTWQGKEQAYLSVCSMSEGAVAIDIRGYFLIQFTE